MKLRILNYWMMAFMVLLVFSACNNQTIKLLDARYGENTTMAKKILVAYGSRAGSTAEIADVIGKTLAAGGAVVDVKSVKDVQDIKIYQAIVLGSAIRKGQVLPEVTDFVQAHKTELKKLPVAYFIVCMTLKENTEEKRKIANAYLDPLRTMINPVATGFFAGKMDYSSLDFISKVIVKYFVKTPEGDYRDWTFIKSWATHLLPKLGIMKNQT
jgi:menaquinone-dependent protoporphyrinogen oxidase